MAKLNRSNSNPGSSSPDGPSPGSGQPYLLWIYRCYRQNGNILAFRAAVRGRYTVPTLERILLETTDDSELKCAVAAAFQVIGSTATVGEPMANLLRDQDPDVRKLAEETLRECRFLDGTPEQQMKLRSLDLANKRGDYHNAAMIAKQLTEETPTIAETWYQMGLTLVGKIALGDNPDELLLWRLAAGNFVHAIKLNRYHFDAFVSLGMICEGLQEWPKAKRSYEFALNIHPYHVLAAESLNTLPARRGRYE